MVEITFHYRVAEIVMGSPIDQSLRHDSGFEPSVTCLPQTKGNGRGLRPDECCSEYPFRFPYSSDSGSRNCCGSKTYNQATLECCDETNSILESIGNCQPYVWRKVCFLFDVLNVLVDHCLFVENFVVVRLNYVRLSVRILVIIQNHKSHKKRQKNEKNLKTVKSSKI